MAIWDQISSVLFGSTADPRSRENQQLDKARVHLYNQAYNQYAQAMSNPEHGMPPAADRDTLEKNIIDKVYSGRSAVGGGFSPMNQIEVGKALAEFRLNLLDRQQKSREALFTGLSGLLGGPRNTGPVSSPGLLQRAGGYVGGKFLERGTQGVLDKMWPTQAPQAGTPGTQQAGQSYTEQTNENQAMRGV